MGLGGGGHARSSGPGHILSAHLCVLLHYLGPGSPFAGYLCLIVPHVRRLTAESVRCWPIRTRSTPPLSPRPQTGRPRMTNAYGHTTGKTPEPVPFSKAQLVLRSETTWEHWVLYAFFYCPFSGNPPRCTPRPPSNPLPPLPPNLLHTWRMCHCVPPCSRRPPSTPTRRPRRLELISGYE